MSVYVHLSLLIHQMNQPVPQRMWRFAWCPSLGGANSAAPPPADRCLGPLFVVAYPVLAVNVSFQEVLDSFASGHA